MTNRNDERNWVVITIKGNNPPKIAHFEQAENKARAMADVIAGTNPGTLVCVYKREATVTGTVATKWE